MVASISFSMSALTWMRGIDQSDRNTAPSLARPHDVRGRTDRPRESIPITGIFVSIFPSLYLSQSLSPVIPPRVILSLALSLSLPISLYPSRYISASFSFCLSLLSSLYLFQYHSSLCHPLPVSLSLFISLSLPRFLSISPDLSRYHPLSVSLSLSLPISICFSPSTSPSLTLLFRHSLPRFVWLTRYLSICRFPFSLFLSLAPSHVPLPLPPSLSISIYLSLSRSFDHSLVWTRAELYRSVC